MDSIFKYSGNSIRIYSTPLTNPSFVVVSVTDTYIDDEQVSINIGICGSEMSRDYYMPQADVEYRPCRILPNRHGGVI
jgi:hypothetical protein